MIILKIILLLTLFSNILWLLKRPKLDVLGCGLVGYYSATKDYDIQKMKLLLLYNESRGDHSTGLYIKDVGIAKSVGKCSIEFLPKISFPKKGKLVIGHTRQKTQGDITKKNAHPFRSGDIVLAHNGRVDNKYDLCKEMNLNSLDFDVDSSVLPAILTKLRNEGEEDFIAKVLSKVESPAALIFTDEKSPDDILYFFRRSAEVESSRRPLFRGCIKDGSDEGFYLSSLEESLNAIGCYSIAEVKEDYLYWYSEGKLGFKKIPFPKKEKERKNKNSVVCGYYPNVRERQIDFGNQRDLLVNGKYDWCKVLEKEMATIDALNAITTRKPLIGCTACKGSGWLRVHENYITCPACNNYGKLPVPQGQQKTNEEAEKCSACEGSGILDSGYVCSRCEGIGFEVEDTSSPFDTHNESTLRKAETTAKKLIESVGGVTLKEEATEIEGALDKEGRLVFKGDHVIVLDKPYKGWKATIVDVSVNGSVFLKSDARSITFARKAESVVLLKTAKNMPIKTITDICKKYNISPKELADGMQDVENTNVPETEYEVTPNNCSTGSILGFAEEGEDGKSKFYFAEVKGIDTLNKFVTVEVISDTPGRLVTLKMKDCNYCGRDYRTMDSLKVYSTAYTIKTLKKYLTMTKREESLYAIIKEADEMLLIISTDLIKKDAREGLGRVYELREAIREELTETVKADLNTISDAKEKLKVK